MIRALLRPAALLGGFLLAVACTQDFDSFQVGGRVDAAAGNGGTLDAAGGSGGNDVGAGTGGDGAGAAGAAGGDGGTDGPADVVCGAGQKACLGTCVPTDDPRYGCASSGCTPCNGTNATVACDAQGQCLLTGCDPGFADCDTDAATGCEINTQQGDPNNCGACRNTCTLANAISGCAASECTIIGCQPGFANCDSVAATGCETNLLSPRTCGSCTRDCTTQAGNWVCSGGTCIVSQCPTGLADCDFDPTTCETDTNTSLIHCGFCLNLCVLPNATTVCNAGQCEVASCNPNFADCDGIPGCEANLLTNPAHCGDCERACSADNTQSRICSNGVCGSTCQPGFGNCSQPATGPDDGCETNLNTSPLHCGACGRACSNTNTQNLACTGGLCTSSCRAGFSNCSRPLAPAQDDGCEAATDDDVDNCGACNYVCGSQNVTTRACSGGECTPLCQAGFSSCDAARPAIDDGCEANTATDVRNCGGCGRSCSTASVGSLSCAGGVCNSTCALGFANCTTPAYPTSDNGCELDVSSNNASCGGCGNSCTAQNGLVCGGQDATSGVCGCDETNSRCRVSGGSGTCLDSGVCQCPLLSGGAVTCRPGEYCVRTTMTGPHECSCNGAAGCAAGQTCCQTPAGCFDLSTDAQNCGACGRLCPAGFACSSGSCRCSGAASCDAGGGGTCNASGLCVCGTTTCPLGRRCQRNGQCG